MQLLVCATREAARARDTNVNNAFFMRVFQGSLTLLDLCDAVGYENYPFQGITETQDHRRPRFECEYLKISENSRPNPTPETLGGGYYYGGSKKWGTFLTLFVCTKFLPFWEIE